MELDHDICYRALQTRDARFDGRFFTGVTSTGIYCRPICPARTPKRSNCVFLACAAAAEEAGFRACRRCRPETAPGTPAWQGTPATVSRALRLINEGALDDGSVEALAARLGVGDRHLRRLFAEQLGASPQAVAQTRRVHLARQLIAGTRMPMGRIALAAGFHNARRFNAAVQRSFAMSPTQIRRDARNETVRANGKLELRLAYRAPLDWPGLLGFLEPRLIPGVESIDGDEYRRTIRLEEFAGVIAVAPDPRAAHSLRLTVPIDAAPYLSAIAGRVRSLFDLDADPAAIAQQLGEDSHLRPLVEAYPGIRIPGAWDRFEVAVRAILGQQVTVAGATRLAGRLVERFGSVLPTAGEEAAHPDRLFPLAEDLAEIGDDEMAAIGLPRARARTILHLARAIRDREPILESGAGLDEAVERLIVLPGIGDWTAQYVALRALGEPDGFPSGDLGLRKALAERGEMPSIAQVRMRAETWRPWRAYAALLLWRGLSVEAKGRS